MDQSNVISFDTFFCKKRNHCSCFDTSWFWSRTVFRQTATVRSSDYCCSNFKSTDYLYAKIDLLSSKIAEGDSVFLNSIGLPQYAALTKIKIEPIVDL
jgi:hypothetical protein